MATAINFIRYWRYTYGEIPHQRVIEFCAGVSSADAKRALEYFERKGVKKCIITHVNFAERIWIPEKNVIAR